MNTCYVYWVYFHTVLQSIPATFPSSEHLFLGLPTYLSPRGLELETSLMLSGCSVYFLIY